MIRPFRSDPSCDKCGNYIVIPVKYVSGRDRETGVGGVTIKPHDEYLLCECVCGYVWAMACLMEDEI